MRIERLSIQKYGSNASLKSFYSHLEKVQENRRSLQGVNKIDKAKPCSIIKACHYKI